MFPSGIMAQQSVLRVWTDRQASTRVAIPELSHLLCYEADGPQQLNAFRFERLTTGPTVPTAEHLQAIPGRLGAVLLELPLRDAGYLLPTWDELEAFSVAARERDVPLHFDGARLWESQPYLDHTLAEIAALADTVYVSFYKGLGGLAGAIVAGPEDVVDEARRWRTRHGGTLFSMTPYALAGLRGLRTHLPLMGELHERAVELAAAFEQRGFRVFPQPPHANAFRIFVDQPEEEINERIVRSLEADRVALIQPFQPGQMPGTAWTEFTVGAGTLEWKVDEAADALALLLG
jgi:threonine aldolase